MSVARPRIGAILRPPGIIITIYLTTTFLIFFFFSASLLHCSVLSPFFSFVPILHFISSTSHVSSHQPLHLFVRSPTFNFQQLVSAYSHPSFVSVQPFASIATFSQDTLSISDRHLSLSSISQSDIFSYLSPLTLPRASTSIRVRHRKTQQHESDILVNFHCSHRTSQVDRAFNHDQEHRVLSESILRCDKMN